LNTVHSLARNFHCGEAGTGITCWIVCILLQTFRRLLLSKCQDEFENRSRATEGDFLLHSDFAGCFVGILM